MHVVLWNEACGPRPASMHPRAGHTADAPEAGIGAASLRLSLGVLGASIIATSNAQCFQFVLLLLVCESFSILATVHGQWPAAVHLDERPSPPSAPRGGVAKAAITLHPITLDISDRAVDAEFVVTMFASCSSVVVRGCFVLAAFLAFLAWGVAGKRPPAGVIMPGGLLSIGIVRLAMKRMYDQAKACYAFSWLCALAMVTCCAVFWMQQVAGLYNGNGSQMLLYTWATVYGVMFLVRAGTAPEEPQPCLLRPANSAP